VRRSRQADPSELAFDETWVAEIEIIDFSYGPSRVHRSGDRLSLADVCVRYGNREAVHDVTMRVAPGEVVLLIGHNGCGKSSTLRAVFGLTPPCAGEVVIDGIEVTGAPQSRRELGVAFVPASGEVFADLTVDENFSLAAGPNAPREVVATRIHDVVTLFEGLRPSLGIHAGKLSGGEQRMVGIGVAMMTEPRLLLLDEPTKHLAPAAAARLLAIVSEQARTRSMAVLIAEVNVAAALQIADRVYVMRSGEITAEHGAGELLAAGPATWWKMF
jgi:branched-chain amino acid transport system ATP-binding protein